jgi:hypothetical protein
MPQETAIEKTKTFTQRLADIGITPKQQEVLGMKAIELVYYEPIAEKLHVKFMEEPAALFYKHGQHTYQRTYDQGYISRLVKKRIDPFTGRAISEHVIMPDPFYKEWLESFVKRLEEDYQLKSQSPTLTKGFMEREDYRKSCV